MSTVLRNILLSLIIILTTVFAAIWLLNKEVPETSHEYEEEGEHEQEFARGRHNGRLLEQDGFALEVTLFETGIPPEFRVYPYSDEQPVDPAAVDLTIDLARTGNVTDRLEFSAETGFLRSNREVYEPHSFDVTVNANYEGRSYQWSFESLEGRTSIPDTLAAEAGVVSEIAGPATIVETRKLTGRVQTDPERVSQVRARFPGVVNRVHVRLGDAVKAGQTLLTVQSNDSMQSYPVTAPIDGLILRRDVQTGETTADTPLFTIVDLSHVWIELDVFPGDTGQVQVGQTVRIETLDGYTAEGTIDWLSPLSSHASQTIHARVPAANPDGRLKPGQFIRAKVGVAAHEVPLAIKRSGLQRFRDADVVFARFGDTYEVRMLEFGVGNEEWVEVIDGLAAGTEYVTENSYLIKADIEKSSAGHDH